MRACPGRHARLLLPAQLFHLIFQRREFLRRAAISRLLYTCRHAACSREAYFGRPALGQNRRDLAAARFHIHIPRDFIEQVAVIRAGLGP